MQQPAPATLSQAIRAHIASDHAAIEGTPVVGAILAGTITRSGYTALLAALLPVHMACDVRIAAVPVPGLAEACRRGAAVAADLAALGGHPRSTPSPAARDLVERIGGMPDAGLIGLGYVVAGSRLGSRVLEPLLRVALQPDNGNGLSFHQAPPDYPRQWRIILEHLDRLPLSVAERGDALDGAGTAMRGMFALYREAG